MFKSVNGVKPPIQRGILGISVENVRIRVQQISYLVLFVIIFLFRTLKDLRNWISSFSDDQSRHSLQQCQCIELAQNPNVGLQEFKIDKVRKDDFQPSEIWHQLVKTDKVELNACCFVGSLFVPRLIQKF